MVTLRAIVVDDEPLAREGLRIRLGWIPDVDVVAECASATAAVAAFAAHKPDVAFVDVEMPEFDGFEMLRRVERGLLPVVIFVTAHEDHALEAFRVGAFDYVVKPFDDDRLRASVERARTYVESLRAPASEQNRLPNRLIVKHEGRHIYMAIDEIDWLEAAGDHVRLHVGAQSYSLRSTMRAMAARLGATRFVRAHRGTLVAVDRIRELEPYSRGEHLLVLRDGTKLPLSRRYRRLVEQAIGRSGSG
jgi:two-component system LytT family response regulator